MIFIYRHIYLAIRNVHLICVGLSLIIFPGGNHDSLRVDVRLLVG